MKPAAEIRAHLANLRTCLKVPCTCKGTHALECRIGGTSMAAVIDALAWTLDENESMNRLVEHYAAEAARLRMEGR